MCTSRPLSISAATGRSVNCVRRASTGSADVFNGSDQGQTVFASIQAAVDAATERRRDLEFTCGHIHRDRRESVVEFTRAKALTTQIRPTVKNQTFIDGENVRCCVQRRRNAAIWHASSRGSLIHNGSSGPVEWGAGSARDQWNYHGQLTCDVLFEPLQRMSGGGCLPQFRERDMSKNCKISGNSAISSSAAESHKLDGGSLVLEGGTSVRQNSTQGSGGGISTSGTTPSGSSRTRTHLQQLAL